jgi:cell division protein FtsQ
MAGARGPARRQLVSRRDRRRPDARLEAAPALARRTIGIACLVAGLVVAAAALAPRLHGAVRVHPYFAVREVAVRHHGQLDDETIRALAGVEVGMSVWDVDAEAVATRLATNGWVRSATVRRQLPDRVLLHVREHRPVAILAVADERPGLYYLAANGRIFAAVGRGDARDLPYVTGLSRADLGGGDAFGPRAVRRALALLRQAARHPRIGVVSELHVDRETGLTLMPTRPALPIEMGWGQHDAKLARVAEVLPLWAGREGELRGVSCAFEDRVVLRTRAARTPATGGKTGTAGKKADKTSATGA